MKKNLSLPNLTSKIELSAIIVEHTFILYIANCLATQIVKEVVDKVSDVFTKSIVKIPKVTAVGSEISV